MTKLDKIQKIKKYYKDMKKSMEVIDKIVNYLNKNDLNFLILSDISSDMFKASTDLRNAARNYDIHRLW